MYAAELSKSSFYYSLKQPDKDEADKAAVLQLFERHRGRYGHRRIAATLCWNKKKAARIMQLLGLTAKVRPKKGFRPPVLGEASDNLLQREFEADAPNQKWLTDVTEFKCKAGKLYLSPILDLYNREITAYSISRRPNSKMVSRMLKRACAGLNGATPLLHSDQGVLYRTRDYRQQLAKYSITQSMSRKGNCWDNAPMESFFAVLKTECFHGECFSSLAQLERTLHEYIRYYNEERCSLKLKNLSPVAYRTQVQKPSEMI